MSVLIQDDARRRTLRAIRCRVKDCWLSRVDGVTFGRGLNDDVADGTAGDIGRLRVLAGNRRIPGVAFQRLAFQRCVVCGHRGLHRAAAVVEGDDVPGGRRAFVYAAIDQ